MANLSLSDYVNLSIPCTIDMSTLNWLRLITETTSHFTSQNNFSGWAWCARHNHIFIYILFSTPSAQDCTVLHWLIINYFAAGEGVGEEFCGKKGVNNIYTPSLVHLEMLLVEIKLCGAFLIEIIAELA